MLCNFRKVAISAVLGAALLCGNRAGAADQAVSGKKLLLKGNPKMVLISKDLLVTAGANGSSADPRCVGDGGGGLGGSVELDDGTNSVTLAMPCANWSTNGAGSLYAYKDTAGVPKKAKIKAGLLKVVSPAGMGGFPVPSGAATIDVEVQVGSDKYCMTFSGTGDGSKFLVKDAAATSCGAPPTPTPTATNTPGGPTATDTPSPTPTDTPGAVTYADVQPIYQAKCSPCHTTLGSGGTNFGSFYADSQLASYYCAGQTKGFCTLVRVQNGSMPAGAGCTGSPVLDSGNPACLTAGEQATLTDWITQGEQP
jgi:hypothetical protein